MLRVHFMYAGNKLLPNNATLYKQTLNDRDDILERPFSRKIIKAIDKSDVLNAREIQSPFLKKIAGSELSGGVKGLLVMAFAPEVREYYFRGEGFGDNCVPYMLEIAEPADIKIALSHLMNFPESGMRLLIENSNRVVTTFDEYEDEYVKYCACNK